MGEVILEARSLYRSFAGKLAVDNLNLELRLGEILGFLGPNGAGKTTSLRMLSGVLQPQTGTILLKGQSLALMQHRLPSLIGYLPEGAPQWAEREVGEFLSFMADLQGMTPVQSHHAQEKYGGMLGLTSVWYQPISTLSKGFRRRVSLAATLLHEPPVLLLDEPTDGLDPNQKQHVHDLLKELSKERAILISTHNLEEVKALCQRVVVIAAGKIVAQGDLASLYALDGQGRQDLTAVFQHLTKGDETQLAKAS